MKLLAKPKPTFALKLPLVPADLAEADRRVAAAQHEYEIASKRHTAARDRAVTSRNNTGRLLSEIEALEAAADQAFTAANHASAALHAERLARKPLLDAYAESANAQVGPAITKSIEDVRGKLQELGALLDGLARLDDSAKQRGIRLPSNAPASAAPIQRIIDQYVLRAIKAWK